MTGRQMSVQKKIIASVKKANAGEPGDRMALGAAGRKVFEELRNMDGFWKGDSRRTFRPREK